jgi:hypothetical protein
MSNLQHVNLGSGDFAFIQDTDDRSLFQNAWMAINLTESWFYMKIEPKDGYLFSNDEQLKIISNKMKELDSVRFGYHSGSSFASIMQNMRYIAENGIDQFEIAWNNSLP